MQVYWLERTESDVPPGNDWLSAGEKISLGGFRFAKRRGDWRLGRWTAKLAVASYLKLSVDFDSLTKVEIRAAPCGAPEVFVDNVRASANISISHRNGTGLCAIAPPESDLGCDLEVIEARSEAFVADYFTPDEQALIANSCPSKRLEIVALLWSAKESVLKALREGLRLDTRSVNVSIKNEACGTSGLKALQACCADGLIFNGWWNSTNAIVRTMVAEPSSEMPIPINPGREEEGIVSTKV